MSKEEERKEIQNAIVSLEALDKYLEKRSWKHSWILFSCIYLEYNEFYEAPARFYKCEIYNFSNELPYDTKADKYLRLEPVVAYDELRRSLKFTLSSYDDFIPNHISTCGVCGEHWSINNINDHYYENRQTEKGQFYHTRCYKLQLAYNETNFFNKILEQAEIDAPLKPIPNKYWGNDPILSAKPWFEFSLPGGDVEIGYRKNVISISGPEFLELDKHFKDENVTKEAGLIHAWGEKKAVQYLKYIAEMLKKPIVEKKKSIKYEEF